MTNPFLIQCSGVEKLKMKQISVDKSLRRLCGLEFKVKYNIGTIHERDLIWSLQFQMNATFSFFNKDSGEKSSSRWTITHIITSEGFSHGLFKLTCLSPQILLWGSNAVTRLATLSRMPIWHGCATGPLCSNSVKLILSRYLPNLRYH